MIVLLCISEAIQYSQSREERRSVNTTTPMDPTGIQLFKKGLAVEDIHNQRGPSPRKKRAGREILYLSSVQIGFILCDNNSTGHLLAELFGC